MGRLTIFLILSLSMHGELVMSCQSLTFITNFEKDSSLDGKTCGDTSEMTNYGTFENAISCVDVCNRHQNCVSLFYKADTKSCFVRDRLVSLSDPCMEVLYTSYYAMKNFHITENVEDIWISSHSKCFLVSSSLATMEEAEISCSENGGRVLQIETEREELFLKSLAKTPEIQGPESCFGYLITGGDGIKDSQLSSSSDNSPNHPGWILDHTRARLNTEEVYDEASGTTSSGGWIGSTDEDNSYIQVQLNSLSIVKGVTTQGRHGVLYGEFVKSYSVEFSNNCQKWSFVKDVLTGTIQVFPGNIDSNAAVTNFLASPVVALCVRLHVVEFNFRKSLRFDLIGCPTVRGPDTCQGFLIRTNPRAVILTSDSDNSASHPGSVVDAERSPLFSRNYLNETDGLHYLGGWQGGKYENSVYINTTYIQVRFDNAVVVRGIATQGRYYYSQNDTVEYVSQYTVEYSYDCQVWMFVLDESKNAKVFQGNDDNNNVVVTRMLDCPVVATCVRLHPKQYVNIITLRFDVLGCPVVGAFRTGGMAGDSGQWLWTATGDPIRFGETSGPPQCEETVLKNIKTRYICEKQNSK